MRLSEFLWSYSPSTVFVPSSLLPVKDPGDYARGSVVLPFVVLSALAIPVGGILGCDDSCLRDPCVPGT